MCGDFFIADSLFGLADSMFNIGGLGYDTDDDDNFNYGSISHHDPSLDPEPGSDLSLSSMI